MKSAVAILIAVLALIGVGYMIGGADARVELHEARAQYAAALATATDARDAANLRAERTEKNWTTKLTDLAITFEDKRKYEKANDDRTIADLRNDVTRLRVRTTGAPSGSELRSPAAGAAVDHGQAEQTLAGSVAARLAGRYAEYNELVGQLDACQAILVIEREPQP